MKPKWLLLHALGAVLTVAAVQPCEARVVNFVVQQTSSYLGGVAWGDAGAYELLRGTAYMEVDPRNPQDSVIVDLENAPLDSNGMVAFSTPFFILKPTDMAHSNNKIF